MSKTNIKSKKSVSGRLGQGRGIKVFATVLCILIIAILAASIALNVILYRKSNEIDLEPPVGNNGVIVNPDETEQGGALLSITSDVATVAADESIVVPITAISSVANVKVKWSIAFANPTSKWADGKNVTDYATVTVPPLTPSIGNRFKANLTVKQAFGEQIIITATRQDDEKISATCTVDYERRVTEFRGFDFEPMQTEYNECTANITPNVTWSIGTVEPEYTQSISIKPTDAYIDFYTRVVYESLKAMADAAPVRDFLIGYEEVGVDSLTPKLYGVCIEDSSSFPFPTAVSFIGANMASARIKLHMQRMLGYSMCFHNPYDITQMTLSIYENRLSDLGKDNDFALVNEAFNERIRNYNGLTDLMGGYFYSLENAFEITYEYKSAHSTIKETQTLSFIFSPFQ